MVFNRLYKKNKENLNEENKEDQQYSEEEEEYYEEDEEVKEENKEKSLPNWNMEERKDV